MIRWWLRERFGRWWWVALPRGVIFGPFPLAEANDWLADHLRHTAVNRGPEGIGAVVMWSRAVPSGPDWIWGSGWKPTRGPGSGLAHGSYTEFLEGAETNQAPYRAPDEPAPPPPRPPP